MKDFFFLIALAVLAGTVVAVGIWAADTDTTTGTVTVINYAISIATGETSFAYGTMPNNSASSTMTLFTGTGITATNDGSTADFDIYGANTGSWTLNTATSTANNYTHKFCNETVNACLTSGVYGASFTALTTSPAVLSASVANAASIDFQLSMHTPNPSTVYTEQSAVVTVQASAP